MRDVAGELVDELANVDGRLLRSLRYLLFKPGVLTREHFDGRRARYLSPLRLYLLASVFCFSVMALVPTTLYITCSSCEAETRPAQEQVMGEAFARWTPRAMVLLVPLFAGLVAVATRRAKRNYPQHLYFALHVQAAWGIAIGVAILGAEIPMPYAGPAFTIAVVLFFGQYLKLALARAYDVSFWRSVAVAPLILVFYYVVVVAVVVAIVAFASRAN